MESAAQKFLEQAESFSQQINAHEKLLGALESAEELLPNNPSLLCCSAKLLFRYGTRNQKTRFFLLALDKLKAAEEIDPDFFQTTPDMWHLWGNVLVQIGKCLDEPHFYEQAFKKYADAEALIEKPSPVLYWDWGAALSLHGRHSGEVLDLKQALVKLNKAKLLGCRSSFFQIEYGCTLASYGKLMGDPQLVDQALSLFQGVIADHYYPDQEPGEAYIKAFRHLALSMHLRYMLSHDEEHFKEADRIFREAIVASNGNSELWLDWGEMYLHSGWLRQEAKRVEISLEKLTSSKIKECDPLRVSALLGRALVSFGLLIDHFKLIKDGQTRVEAALDVAPGFLQLKYAFGFCLLGNALFFSDQSAYAKAASIFEEAILEDATSSELRHALFQTYLSWGILNQDADLASKGVKAIGDLSSMHSHSAHYLNEWGAALLRLRELEADPEKQLEYVEEAIFRFQKAWNLCSTAEILCNWGCALDLLGDLTGDEEDYEKSISLLTQAFEKYPSNPRICYQLGLAFLHLGELNSDYENLSQAVKLLGSVAKVQTENEEVLCNFGYALLNLSELVLDHTIPHNGETLRQEAEKNLLSAAVLGSGEACFHLACLYSLAGLFDASVQYLKKADASDYLPTMEDLRQDEWLEGVRNTAEFQEFLNVREDHG